MFAAVNEHFVWNTTLNNNHEIMWLKTQSMTGICLCSWVSTYQVFSVWLLLHLWTNLLVSLVNLLHSQIFFKFTEENICSKSSFDIGRLSKTLANFEGGILSTHMKFITWWNCVEILRNILINVIYQWTPAIVKLVLFFLLGNFQDLQWISDQLCIKFWRRRELKH